MSWLTDTPWAAELSADSRARLARLVPGRFEKGEILFRPGDAARGYLVVLAGRIAVHLVGPNGREILLYEVGIDQSCIQTTLGLLAGENYSAEAVVQEDCKAVLIPRALFFELLDSDPAFRRAVFVAFAARMQTVMHLFEAVAFTRVEARLARHLVARADSKGIVEATQAELARAVGTAREVVSRQLEVLERRALLRRERGHIRLLDPEALAALAEKGGA